VSRSDDRRGVSRWRSRTTVLRKEARSARHARRAETDRLARQAVLTPEAVEVAADAHEEAGRLELAERLRRSL
jgi:hypothetical protein